MNRHAYGFEVDRKFCNKVKDVMLRNIQLRMAFEQNMIGG